ncbi:MAG: (2Fe-2S)-binding protein [Hyphomicrobiales bacterium]|nr:(2Fe-2S)-binding protein [Hyphomicrobiales bacterium]MCP5372428.1 (2Fe-2S)-binding protein [Hyphomicrobiales bacterium]
MFKRLHENGAKKVRIFVDGAPTEVPAGETVAAALLAGDDVHCRTSSVSGEKRAPHCLIGVCFECLVEVDGQPNRQACMTRVADGMKVRRQQGAGGGAA